ncbi:hypothetical protein [Vibrio cincinnatiensis]|uniref:hypothetical protein n=1 Tax=Vibrio cincinnatiensis TaxID=675 RepID=UPI0038ADE84B
MLEVELFEKVRSGEITSTKEFRVNSIRRGTDDWKKDKTFSTLLHYIDSGYITGVYTPDENGNYESLKITPKGLEVYNFMTTPMNRLCKPTFWEVCRNGIISAFAGKIVWWVVATIVLIVFPSILETVTTWIKTAANWVLGVDT